jgi:hypothetical protein
MFPDSEWDSIRLSTGMPTISRPNREAVEDSQPGVAQRTPGCRNASVADRFAVGGICFWRQGDRRRGGRERRVGLRGDVGKPDPVPVGLRKLVDPLGLSAPEVKREPFIDRQDEYAVFQLDLNRSAFIDCWRHKLPGIDAKRAASPVFLHVGSRCRRANDFHRPVAVHAEFKRHWPVTGLSQSALPAANDFACVCDWDSSFCIHVGFTVTNWDSKRELLQSAVYRCAFMRGPLQRRIGGQRNRCEHRGCQCHPDNYGWLDEKWTQGAPLEKP